MSDHPWSNELQAFLDTHPTHDDILRDLDSLPDAVARELFILLTVQEILGDAVRDGYLKRVK
jgi:hypothetical protein